MREPKIKNKYHLKPADINKLVVNDRSKIKEPLFWRNDVINAWCISKSIGTDADRKYCTDNSVWIGIYDKPYYHHEVHYYCTCWGGMVGYWNLLDECSNEGVYCSVCNKKVYKKYYANQKV